MRPTCKFLNSLSFVFENAIDPDTDLYVAELCEALDARIKQGKEKDMKEIDFITTREFFALVSSALYRYNKTSKKDMRGIIETRIFINGIKSDNLMRKIRGITLLKDTYDISAMCNIQMD